MNLHSIIGLVVVVAVLLLLLWHWVDRRQAAKSEAMFETLKDISRKVTLNSELVHSVRETTTAAELEALIDEIVSRKSELFDDDFANLLERIRVRSQELDG